MNSPTPSSYYQYRRPEGPQPVMAESPLQRICREARERRADILAHPGRYTAKQVQDARHAAEQSARISLASNLRYGD